jgi:hypothetical protein
MVSNLNAADLATKLRTSARIDKSEVLTLMHSSDIEILGVLYDATSDAQVLSHIRPALSNDDAQKFLRHYFGRCLRENTPGEWADSRYTAAWDAANWLRAKWPSLSEIDRDDWKTWLANLYLQGDTDLRQAIETALLEHILGDKEIAHSFRNWEDTVLLRDAYRASLSVARGLFSQHGKLE